VSAAPRRDDSRATPIGICGDFPVNLGASMYCGVAAGEIGPARAALAGAIEDFIDFRNRIPRATPATDAREQGDRSTGERAGATPFLSDKEW
jgi:hypothetical protein